MPVWSKSGDKTCFDVQIINDNVIEETEQFVIHFLVHDLNVDIPMAYARADVNIIDDDVPEGKQLATPQICDCLAHVASSILSDFLMQNL